MDEPVLVKRRGGVLEITLNRPERRNAVNVALSQGVSEALDLLDEDPDLAVGVLTGSGGTFCAGMDLKAYLEGERPMLEGRGFAGIVARPPAKPICAAVEGYALAGGFEIVLACDLVVAARDARFGLPEVKRGLAAGGGGILRLAQRVPPAVGLEVVLTGDPLSAERAKELNLVTALAEPGQSLEVALEFAERIAANAPLAVQASKRLSAAAAVVGDDIWAEHQRTAVELMNSEDAREGARAFAAREAPRWQGR